MLNDKLTEEEVDTILNKEFTARQILSFAPFMVCLVNKSGFLEDVNEMFEDVLGYSRDDIIKTPFINFIHPEDKDKTVQAYLKGNVFNENGKFYKGFENRYLTKDGKSAKLEWYSTDKSIGESKLSYAIFRGYE